jgi:hypothetical protein
MYILSKHTHLCIYYPFNIVTTRTYNLSIAYT